MIKVCDVVAPSQSEELKNLKNDIFSSSWPQCHSSVCLFAVTSDTLIYSYIYIHKINVDSGRGPLSSSLAMMETVSFCKPRYRRLAYFPTYRYSWDYFGCELVPHSVLVDDCFLRFMLAKLKRSLCSPEAEIWRVYIWQV